MLNNAKQILVSELVLTEHSSKEEIEELVENKITTSFEEYKVDNNVTTSEISKNIMSKFIPFDASN